VLPAITVSPASIALRPKGSVKFSVSVVGLSNTGVTWSVEEGAPGGTITGTGEYTAPDAVGTYHVVATSSASPSVQGRATVTVTAPITDLPVGTWTNVTPPELRNGRTRFGYVGIAPGRPSTAYTSTSDRGLWKTTDSGKNWVQCGKPNGAHGDSMTEYLENPSRVEVDPADPDHFYVTEGVDGARPGFWISKDGCATFIKTKGFQDVAKMVGGPGHDVVAMAVDPGNFKRIIISPHSDWGITAGYTSGILESRDGGESWIAHMPPNDAWSNGTKGVFILRNPATGKGDGNLWLVTDETSGFWRTENAGQTWTKVTDATSPHGCNQFFYASNGALYAGAWGRLMRSEDDGATWTRIDSLPNTNYYSNVYGTGELLFTMAFSDAAENQFYTSPEDDGLTWKLDTTFGKTAGSPLELRYDSVNRILYSPNYGGGLWVLRMPE
jgi:hypothetical protein